MSLTLSLSPDIEAKLRERAAVAGRDVAQFASEIVEKALAFDHADHDEVSDAERLRLKAAVHELLERAKHLEVDPNRPQLKGRKAEFEQGVVEKFRKQGLGA